MVLRLGELVPEGYDRWYFHEETGLLLHNDGEYGWLAKTSLDRVAEELSELGEAISAAKEAAGISAPSTVLPLPDDYE